MDGEGRRTRRSVGDPHPEGASPPAQAALRDPRHVGHGVRGRGDSGEARAEDAAEEGAGVKRSLAAHPAAAYPNTAFNSRNFASPAWPSHAVVSSSATPRSLASRWIAFQASLLGRTWSFSHRLTVEKVTLSASASPSWVSPARRRQPRRKWPAGGALGKTAKCDASMVLR